MSHSKPVQLELVKFENVTFQVEGLDPVLKSVDLDLPMDQTVLVQATDPTHAVNLLEILAGRRAPQVGKVKWLDASHSEGEINAAPFYEVVASCFESQRPNPNVLVNRLLRDTGANSEIINFAIEHFELSDLTEKKFKEVSYEIQKLLMLIVSTMRTPQMLVLEDPAVGLSESRFLDFLDWVQYWQRQGYIRHLFLTNNHPTAGRHIDALTLFVDDGLIYIEDVPVFKKLMHF